MDMIERLLQMSLGQVDLERAIAPLQNLLVWYGVVLPSLIATDILGHFLAKRAVSRADDAIRTARNKLFLAAFMVALGAGVAALLWPAIGGDLSSALGVGILVLAVDWLLIFLLSWADPATRMSE